MGTGVSPNRIGTRRIKFYLLDNSTVKHISLKEEIVTEIKNIFINGGAIFKPEGIEEDVFDGNIISRNGENITYVHYDLPEDFARIPYNQADMSEYNINEDMPKSIFYYDDGKFYFQVFNKTCYNEKWSCSLNVEIYLQK